MEIIKNSIISIIITIFLFLFVISFSLQKGIYLHDFKLKNIYIKKLYIKSNSKIILKIENLTIKKSKQSNTNYKIITKLPLIANILEIYIHNPNYTLFVKNGILTAKTKIASIKIDLKKLKIVNILSKQYNIKTNLKIMPKDNSLFIKGNLIFNKSVVFADFVINKDSINANLKSIYFKLKNISIQDINTKIIYNLKNGNFQLTGKIDKLYLKYQNNFIEVKNIKINNIKNYLILSSPTIYGEVFKYISTGKNLVLISNINNIQNITLILREGSFYQNNSLIKLKNIQLLKKDNYYLLKIDKSINRIKEFLISTKNITADYENQLSLQVSNIELKNKIINLKAKNLLGNKKCISIPKITGKIYSFKTEVNSTKIYPEKNRLYINNTIINNIKLKKISYNDKNKTLIFYSNTLFNKNLKDILNQILKISLPKEVLQIKGENYIKNIIKFTPSIQNKTFITTKNSILNIFSFPLKIEKGDINISNEYLKFYTPSSTFFINKELNLTFKGDGVLDFNKSFLNMNGKISGFNLEPIIKLPLIDDSIYIDFNKSFLKEKKLGVFIDFNKNFLKIASIKKALQFSKLYPIIKNGNILFDFNKQLMYVNLIPKLPIVYIKNKALNKIKFKISFLDTIKIINPFINIIINKTNTTIHTNNIEIDFKPLEELLLDNNSSNNNSKIKIYSKNTNIRYGVHKILSQKLNVIIDKEINFKSYYKNSSIKGYSKQNYILISGKSFHKKEIDSLIGQNLHFIKKIDADFVMVKSPDNFITGKIFINKATIKGLKAINNIIAFINTIPALASFSSPGFSTQGYKIKDSYIDYIYNNKIIYIKKAYFKGDNISIKIDKGYIDLNTKKLKVQLTTLLKMKLKNIPIIGKAASYILFGKDNAIDIKIIVYNTLDNPKVKEDIGKEIISIPLNLLKRTITLPFNIF